MSKFSDLKQYLNNVPIGELVLRKDLLNITGYAGSTDSYRRCFTLLGFINETGKCGVFKKMKNIPEKFMSSDLQYAYKNKRYKLKK